MARDGASERTSPVFFPGLFQGKRGSWSRCETVPENLRSALALNFPLRHGVSY